MKQQGGVGGVPRDDRGDDAQHRKAPAARSGPGRAKQARHEKDQVTPAADTDEASRLDRPQDPDNPRKDRTVWESPHGD
ncbi:hypothetical protein [Streptomyces sp. NPDC051211]|uniref:hypothetical protein n=1 Tax=Streptomyces sp. NPDC051211 TaxID=3154643 RepID=UPI00344FDA70